MESILKMTNGVGSTFYDLDMNCENTRGLWIIPNNRMELLKSKQKINQNFTFKTLDSSLLFDVKQKR